MYHLLAKYKEDYKKIQKEIDRCSRSISNLKEMINETILLCQNLRKLWVDWRRRASNPFGLVCKTSA